MKATGSKLYQVQETIDFTTDMKGEVYYDYERDLYAVFINEGFVAEYPTEDQALDRMHQEMGLEPHER